MRIAYVTYEVPDEKSGVAKKIAAQSRFWRARGHTVRHFILGAQRDTPQPPDQIEFLVSSRARPPMLAAWLSNATIRARLRAWRPDLIYVRQMLWWPGAVHALDVAPLVIEYNSIARNEYRATSRVKFMLECASRAILPRRAAGIVAVTRELADDVPVGPSRRAVISNGFDFSRCTPRHPPRNARPQLLLVGSPGQSWHGVDKVARLAAAMPDLDFHLVVPGLTLAGPANLVCHGGLYGDALARRYAETDVALGTLALHRKGMQEAAPLKTREYLAYGIPVIAGYRDADLDGADYWLDIGNDEDNVLRHAEAIRDFVGRWRGVLPDRADIERRLGYDHKETERLAFFASVLGHGG